MKKISKITLKNLIAQNDITGVIEDLFELFSAHIEAHGAQGITEYYDKLILFSGKLNGISQELNLGIIDNKFANIEKSRINYGILSLINEIPNKVFAPKKTPELPPQKAPDLRNRVNKELSQKEFEFDIFLSFSSVDQDFAKQIWEELRGYGLKVFLSNESLKVNVGQSFFEKIQYALVNSKHFVLICTPNSMESEWVKTEYETFYNEFYIGKNNARKLIILKGQGFEMDHVPILLRRLQFATDVKQIIESFLDSNAPKVKRKTVRASKKKVPTKTKKPVVKKVSSTANFEKQLSEHLEEFKSYDDFHFGSNIPSRKLKNASRTCAVPKDEEIIALIDATVFGSAEEAILFGKKGIYYHNGWTASKSGAGFIPYADFKNRNFSELDANEINLDKGEVFDRSGSNVTMVTALHVLNGIKEICA